MRRTSRREEARRLRAEGWSYPQIAARLGMTKQGAHVLVNRTHDTRCVWVRLPRATHARLQREYEQSARRRGRGATDRGFSDWLSRRAARALET
jgi:hypothetical protein